MTLFSLAAVLLSSALLFFIEPMFARMVLPMLGGSPAVWNTALVFYQAALLAGYAYVHWSTTWLGVRRQAFLHFLLVAVAVACLPIALPAGWRPPAGGPPIPWLLAVLSVAVGLPFLVVSTTTPLVQKWFAATRHPWAADPYFLYAASNAGSLLGLLGYPLLIEPRLRLVDQSRLWSWGYGALAAIVLMCAFLTRRSQGREHLPSAPPPTALSTAAPLGVGRRLRWLMLAFVPSSLMMGATMHVTTDIAAIPLLWVGPLAIYLLSFILAFARRSWVPPAFWARALPLLVLPLLVVMVGQPAQPLLLILVLHGMVLFVASMVCHGELAQDRPPTEHLTAFYLWVALGGALGGVFNALVAPRVFHAVVEYPIAIALACMMAPSRNRERARLRTLDVLLPVALAALGVAVVLILKTTGGATRAAVVCVAALVCFPIYGLSRRPIRFGLAVAAMLLVNLLEIAQGKQGLHAERSFFGMHRVLSDPARGLNALYHGTTLHGVQRVRPRWCRVPLGYYGRTGPLGEVFQALVGKPLRSVAVAGLGTGAIAAYALPSQRWTFFEIDPAVKRIASDPRYFCYLEDSPVEPRVVLGDARLSLARTGERFDLIVLDAYSSDAIPVHLLTREALALYLDHLTAHGVVVFHISNHYFRLAPVVTRLASDAGLRCWIRESSRPAAGEEAAGLLPSTYAVVARRSDDVGNLAIDRRWEEREPGPAAALWTDDYSSLLSVLRAR